MKTFKLYDFWIQVVLITGGTVCSLLNISLILYACLAAVGWQLISSIIHALLKHAYIPLGDRKRYQVVLIALFIAGIVTIPVWIFYEFALLTLSPLLAVWYAHICYVENQILKHKAFARLK